MENDESRKSSVAAMENVLADEPKDDTYDMAEEGESVVGFTGSLQWRYSFSKYIPGIFIDSYVVKKPDNLYQEIKCDDTTRKTFTQKIREWITHQGVEYKSTWLSSSNPNSVRISASALFGIWNEKIYSAELANLYDSHNNFRIYIPMDVTLEVFTNKNDTSNYAFRDEEKHPIYFIDTLFNHYLDRLNQKLDDSTSQQEYYHTDSIQIGEHKYYQRPQIYSLYMNKVRQSYHDWVKNNNSDRETKINIMHFIHGFSYEKEIEPSTISNRMIHEIESLREISEQYTWYQYRNDKAINIKPDQSQQGYSLDIYKLSPATATGRLKYTPTNEYKLNPSEIEDLFFSFLNLYSDYASLLSPTDSEIDKLTEDFNRFVPYKYRKTIPSNQVRNYLKNRYSNCELTPQELKSLFNSFLERNPNHKELHTMTLSEIEILSQYFEDLFPATCKTSDNVPIKKHICNWIITGNLLGTDMNASSGQSQKHDFDKKAEKYKEKSKVSPSISIKNFKNNDIINLFLTVSQSFITVITGMPGSAKGALCDALGEDLGDRYQDIMVSNQWRDRDSFISECLKPTGAHYQLFKWLDYEAQEKNGEGITLPYIICFKNASATSPEFYFEDFIKICKDWYRKKEHTLYNASLKVPKTLRFIFVMNYAPDGILSSDLAGLVNVIDVSAPEKLKDFIKDNHFKYKDYFNTLQPCFTVSGSDSTIPITPEETWNNGDDKYKNCKNLYKKFMNLIQKDIKINGSKAVLQTNRMEHAISRYLVKASDYLSNENVPPFETIKNTYIPTGVIVDEDDIPRTDSEDSSKAVPAEMVALDYAFAQRILPCFTKIKDEVSVDNPSELVEFLLENKLFRCAGLFKEALDSGKLKVADQLSDDANNEFIIKKCENLYKNLMANSWEPGETDDWKPDDVVKHICSLVNQYRDEASYTQNVVVNMLLCLTQGFLTVFSGKPGCGKTSICNILGRILGLSDYTSFNDRRNDVVDPSRYFVVSTERGWTSKRDFIGFYNPLTEQFDKTNAALYNAFLVMDHQARNNDPDSREKELPMFILLDEANLSPMEYYWADFMNLCEAWNENHSIDLGGGKVFKIPETLHFIATINNDHTTELLSPRLIDRANVIDLPPIGNLSALNQSADGSEASKITPIPWSLLKETFGCSESEAKLLKEDQMDAETDEDFEWRKTCRKIYEDTLKFMEKNFALQLSPRTSIAVSRYWTQASELFTEQIYWVKDNLKELATLDTDGDQDELRRMLENLLKNCILTINPNQSDEESEDGTDYTEDTVSKELQALDYAIAQRVLPKITEVNGDDALTEMIGLMNHLRNNQLYKSAGIACDMIQRGIKSGFYNYFR